MKKWMMMTLGLCAAVAVWDSPVANAQDSAEDPVPAFVDENGDGIDDNAAMRHRRGRRSGKLLSVVFAELSEEERAALQEMINGLIANGATRTEINDAIFSELEGYGVDLTDNHLERLGSVLSEEQLSSLQEKIDALKADGATHSEIQAAIRSEMESLGIERGKKRPPGLGSVLSEEQMASLQAKIDGLVSEGASRTEIREAINVELETLGVELPQRGTQGKGFMGRRGKLGHPGARGFRGRGPRPFPAPDAEAESGDNSSSDAN